MREIVDHYFPPVGLLVKGGGEEFTDFNYWRDRPLDIVDFTDSEDEDDDPIVDAVSRLEKPNTRGSRSILSEDEAGDDMADSYLSADDRGRPSLDQSIADSFAGDYDDDDLTSSIIDDEDQEYEDGEYEEESAAEDEYEVEDSRGGTHSPVAPRTPERGNKSGSPAVSGDARTPRKWSDDAGMNTKDRVVD